MTDYLRSGTLTFIGALKMAGPDVLTENGENAFSTTSNANVDLFFSLVRNIEPSRLEELLTKSWTENKEITMKIISYIRDCRNGLGERALFYYTVTWLLTNFPSLYNENLEHFISLGSYKDLLMILLVKDALEIKNDRVEIDLFANVLVREESGLSSKWAPSEGGRFTKYAKELANKMTLRSSEYRKMLTNKRSKLNLIETKLCQQALEDIDFSKIPSQALYRYRNALSRDHNAEKVTSEARQKLAERYKKYLEDVSNGEKKINTSTLMPHQITTKARTDKDETLNAMWNDIVAKLKSKATGRLSKSIAISDVSGSMSSVRVAEGVTALDVSIALGLLIAEVSSFADRQIITFSRKPSLARVPEGTIHEKVKFVDDMDWGGNTDIFAVFQLLIGKKMQVDTLFIFTDMQFDQACPQSDGTIFDKIRAEYRKNEMEMPHIIFWNLNGKFDIRSPVLSDERGVSLISGFSSHVLSYFIDDVEMSPVNIMMKALERYSPKYDVTNELSGKTIEWEKVKKAITHPKGNNTKTQETDSDSE